MTPRNPLRCLVPGLSLNLIGTGAGGTNTILPDATGAFGANGSNDYWTQLETPARTTALFGFDTFSDITGLVRGSQTLFPVSWTANQWLHPKIAYFATAGSAAAVKAYEVDIVWISSTSKPDALPTSTHLEEYITGNQYSLTDDKSFSELVGYGWSSFSTEGQLTTSATAKTGAGSFGYLAPTASTRLYHRCFVRIMNWSPSDAGTQDKLEIFPSVITIGQEIDAESDLEYIMRLQRLAIRDPA